MPDRDTPVPMLIPDRGKRTYYYEPYYGKRLEIPRPLFLQAVQTYVEQYRCTRRTAIHKARRLESWGLQKNGTPFYYI